MKPYRNMIIAAVAAAGLASVAQAEPGPDGHGFGPKGGRTPFGDRPTTAILEMMTKRLELTDAQREKIGPILEDTKAKMKDTLEGSKGVLESAKEKISAELTDEQKAKMEKGKGALAGAFGGYVRDHGPEIRERVKGAGKEIALRAALGSLELTGEQREKLKELQERAQEKRETIMKEMKPKLEAIEQDVKETLAATLTPEQLEQLQKRREDMPRPGRHQRPGPEDN